MNASIYITRDYVKLCDWTLGENKPNQTQSQLAPSTAAGLKPNLKKQSQFSKVRIGVSIYKKGYYEEFHALGRRKNKPNSKPNKANRRPLAGNLCLRYPKH